MKRIISLIILLIACVIFSSFAAIAAEQDSSTRGTEQAVRVVSQNVSYSTQGNVITVRNTQACKVGYWDETTKTYAEVPCTASSDNSYRFTAPEGVTEVLLVVIGDVDGNGLLEKADNDLLAKGLLPSDYTDVQLTDIQHFAADVNGNGKVNSADRTLIARNLLPEDHAAYMPFAWNSTVSISYENGTLVFRTDGNAYLYGYDEEIVAVYTGWDTKVLSYEELYVGNTGTWYVSTNIPWYQDRKNILSVVFENGVSPISTDYWFKECANL